MPPPSIHQPHDKLLKATFCQTENASAFFQNHLPDSVAGAFHWESLRLIPSSFIDPGFSSSESDLVFQVRSKERTAFLYLLFEHQSEEDPMMAFRLLSYTLRVWQGYRIDHPRAQRLPPVMGVVLAQNRSPWKSQLSLDALIEIPSHLEEFLRPLQPRLEFRLVELLKIPYDQLRGTPEGVLTLRALKADPVGELLSDPVWDPAILEAVSGDALERILRYICARHPSREDLFNRIRKVPSEKLEPALMTIAEQFHAEGLSEGLSQGLSQGLSRGRAEGELAAQRRAVLKALRIRHCSPPGDLEKRLEMVTSPEILDALHEAAIRSNTFEEFLQSLPAV